MLAAGSIHVQRSARQRSRNENLGKAVEFLIADLKRLSNSAAAAPE